MTRFDGISLWTIYDHPRDFPDHYVARRFTVERGGVQAQPSPLTARDLDSLRSTFAEMGMTCLPRQLDDDPNIVETWI